VFGIGVLDALERVITLATVVAVALYPAQRFVVFATDLGEAGRFDEFRIASFGVHVLKSELVDDFPVEKFIRGVPFAAEGFLGGDDDSADRVAGGSRTFETFTGLSLLH